VKVAFGTVVYKQNANFTAEYINSINSQNYFGFDTLLLNDDLPNEEYSNIVRSIKHNAIALKGKAGATPTELRAELIERSFNKGYDLLVLGDFDDTFSGNRVSEIVKNFDEKHGFFYNDLYHFDGGKKYFQDIPGTTYSLSGILESNYLGLTNTAINLKLLNVDVIKELYTCNSVVFDWFMFLTLLLHGLKGKKVDNCKTFYRFHHSNIAGKQDDTTEEIKKEIQIKLDLYYNLKHMNPIFVEKYNYYNNIRESFDVCSADKQNDYWWSKINSNTER